MNKSWPGALVVWIVFSLFRWPLSALAWFVRNVLGRKDWG